MSLNRYFKPAFRAYAAVVHFLLWPLFAILKRFTSIRIVGVPFGIGELAMDMDLFAKEEALGVRRKLYSIAFIPWHNPVALVASGVNLYLVSLFEGVLSKLIRIRSRIALEIIRPLMLDHSLLFKPDAHQELFRYVDVVKKWGDRPPILRIPSDDVSRGFKVLESMGVPLGSWFVCIHARERSTKPNKTQHNYRDVDIATYTAACKEIVRRGGWVLRMGDSSMKPYKPFDGVIDYIHTEYHSDFMDIFLSSHCRFFLGCNSGLAAVPTLFKIPLATTNGVPVSPITYYNRDIGIMKTAWSDVDQRLVTFPELLAGGYKINQTQNWLSERGWRLIDNTEEEILDLTLEMLAQVESSDEIVDPEDEARQKSFKSLLLPNFHLAYGTDARMGRAFLRKYAHLLPEHRVAAERETDT